MSTDHNAGAVTGAVALGGGVEPRGQGSRIGERGQGRCVCWRGSGGSLVWSGARRRIAAWEVAAWSRLGSGRLLTDHTWHRNESGLAAGTFDPDGLRVRVKGGQFWGSRELKPERTYLGFQLALT